jgi:DNA-binding NarL/FixJ family response regulator
MHMLDRPRIRILISHPDPLVSIGLAAALRPAQDMEVTIGAAEDTIDFDVVVADHDTALRLARERRAGARLIVASARPREHEVRSALELGVRGYLTLGCSLDEFVHGVRAVAGGTRYLEMSIALCVAESLTHEALTLREAQVLALLARGQCNKAIARRLDIAIGTVKAHVKAIMGKLDASTRTQAVSVATHRGLVDIAADRPTAPTYQPQMLKASARVPQVAMAA